MTLAVSAQYTSSRHGYTSVLPIFVFLMIYAGCSPDMRGFGMIHGSQHDSLGRYK